MAREGRKGERAQLSAPAQLELDLKPVVVLPSLGEFRGLLPRMLTRPKGAEAWRNGQVWFSLCFQSGQPFAVLYVPAR